MFPRVTTGRDANAGGAPYASVAFGPLLFALPIPDTHDANTPDPAAKWRFAFDAQGDKLGADITVLRSPMPGKWNWSLESPLKLRVNAASFDWKPTPERALPSEPVAGGGPSEKITLVPYGCTKFRVSMLPVTERTIKLAESENPVRPAGEKGSAR
jgi:hypothetical protein